MVRKSKEEKMINPKKEIERLRKTRFSFIYYIFAGAIVFCLASYFVCGWLQNCLLGFGTGLLTSTIISFCFSVYQRKNEKIQAYQKRIDFMEKLKVCIYNLLPEINFSKICNKVLSLEAYIKEQHRWFHDYYKRIIADNEVERQTQERKNQLVKFYNNTVDFIMTFDAYHMTQDVYSEWQIKEIKSFRDDYELSKNLVERGKYCEAFLHFSSWLEVFKRLICADSFMELSSFMLIEFKYNEECVLSINYDKFEEQESFFKFARQFNAIRKSNYIKQYGKEKFYECEKSATDEK